MDEMIRNEDSNLDQAQNHFDKEQLLGKIEDSVAYEVDVKSLHCPELELNPIFNKLKARLLKFFVIRE